MIVIIDYGLGNIRSVSSALARTGADVLVSSVPEDVRGADGIVLPGVGAFKKAMENIKSLGLAGLLTEHMKGDRPYLGICLGMQILFEVSYEHGRSPGLGFMAGAVSRFAPGVKIPHMGWNQVAPKGAGGMFSGIDDGAYFYFDHSYYVDNTDDGIVSGITDYGKKFASAVAKGNVWGVQFHPEKSGNTGLRLLENFVRTVGG
ncbi:MAG: imidazole glycerol phosphate synthase subunit HisH [Elusimicrobia bacterium]|nr:imidazole glycerol phosphate synthase subunit HisH [Elusimicrobiota bacterium]